MFAELSANQRFDRLNPICRAMRINSNYFSIIITIVITVNAVVYFWQIL